MRRCLIVDDSRLIRRVERRMMETLGFEVSEAEDGHQALARCAAGMPDVVLLDWVMPHMDGLEFLMALRKLAGGTGPRVIFCTSQVDMSFVSRAIEAGADEFVMKPFDIDTLGAKLAEVGLV